MAETAIMLFTSPPAAWEKTMSINISLPIELEVRVRQKVEPGLYDSA